MGTALTLRTNSRKSRWLPLLLLLLTVLVLTGCDSVAIIYPYSSDAKWVCADPEFVLEYSHDSTGQLVQTEYLNYDGGSYSVFINYRGHRFWILPDGSNHYDDRLLVGSWKYAKGELVFEIEEDYVFGGRYSELVFEWVE